MQKMKVRRGREEGGESGEGGGRLWRREEIMQARGWREVGVEERRREGEKERRREGEKERRREAMLTTPPC
jgi:hypothetical protein